MTTIKNFDVSEQKKVTLPELASKKQVNFSNPFMELRKEFKASTQPKTEELVLNPKNKRAEVTMESVLEHARIEAELAREREYLDSEIVITSYTKQEAKINNELMDPLIKEIEIWQAMNDEAERKYELKVFKEDS